MPAANDSARSTGQRVEADFDGKLVAVGVQRIQHAPGAHQPRLWMSEESRAQADVHVAQRLRQQHFHGLADQRIQIAAEHAVEFGVRSNDSAHGVNQHETVRCCVEGTRQQIQRGCRGCAVVGARRHGPACWMPMPRRQNGRRAANIVFRVIVFSLFGGSIIVDLANRKIRRCGINKVGAPESGVIEHAPQAVTLRGYRLEILWAESLSAMTCRSLPAGWRQCHEEGHELGRRMACRRLAQHFAGPRIALTPDNGALDGEAQGGVKS